MAGRVRFGVGLVLIGLLGLGAWGQTPVDPKDDPVIPLVEFDSATVGAVLDLLLDKAQYSVTPDILSLPVGRLRLVNKRVSEILNYIAQQAGLQWRYENGVFFLFRRPPEHPKTKEDNEEKAKPKEEPLPSPPKVVSPTEWQQRERESRPAVQELLRTRNIPVADACYLLGIPFQGISVYQAIHELALVQYRQLQSSFGFPDLPSEVTRRETHPSFPPAASQGMPNLSPDPFVKPSLPSGEVARQLGVGGFGGGFGGFGGAGLPGGVGGVGGVGGIGGVGGFGLGAAGAGIAAYITGIQQIVGIPTLNAILVRGTPEAIEELRRLLDLIDVPPDQVEIESQFVSVVTNLQNIVGIDWSVAGTEVTAVTAGMSSPGSINIGLVRGNLSATLGALIASNRGRVIQAPRAFTINGLPAIFVSAVARPFFIQQAITDAFGNVRTVTLVNIAQITIALIAIPFINEDGTVTVFTQPIVQDIVGEVTNPIGGTVPIITSTFTVSLVRVRSGDSFAIGGLLTTRTTQEDREIPLLARLPLIGGLFRRKSKITDETNLIIFITPRIVPAEEIASS